jgi:FkbM family methyltransferase
MWVGRRGKSNENQAPAGTVAVARRKCAGLEKLSKPAERVEHRGLFSMNGLRKRIRDYQYRTRMAKWEKESAQGGFIIHKIAPGVRMKLYCDSMLSRQILFNDFEADERDFMIRFLRPGDMFVDVGANAGLFTLIAARAVGPKGRVISFEPVSKTNKRLSENVGLNRFTNVQVEQCALSDATGKFSFMVAQDEMDGFNSFARPYMGENYAEETVSTMSWDEYAAKHSLQGRVTFMKIDVEGWETKVLQGGSGQLSRQDAPVLQVEFTDDAAKAAGSSCRENYRVLEGMGYQLYTYDRAGRILKPDAIRDEYPYLNLYAVKDLGAVQARLRR